LLFVATDTVFARYRATQGNTRAKESLQKDFALFVVR